MDYQPCQPVNRLPQRGRQPVSRPHSHDLVSQPAAEVLNHEVDWLLRSLAQGRDPDGQTRNRRCTLSTTSRDDLDPRERSVKSTEFNAGSRCLASKTAHPSFSRSRTPRYPLSVPSSRTLSSILALFRSTLSCVILPISLPSFTLPLLSLSANREPLLHPTHAALQH